MLLLMESYLSFVQLMTHALNLLVCFSAFSGCV
jgi:hypothetical protein